MRWFAALATVVSVFGFASLAQATLVSITGGSAIGVPSGNDVLGPPGNVITAGGGGSIWKNGTLSIGSPNVTLTLYDVGSESGWQDQIRLGNTSGSRLRDYDDYGGGTGGVHSPYQLVGSVTQNPGVVDIKFWRSNGSASLFQVQNGHSPHQRSGGIASIAFAYLSDANQIVSSATDRILVLLDDRYSHLPDKDYDDYVGILVASAPVPLPAAAWLLLSGLGALGVVSRRRPPRRTS